MSRAVRRRQKRRSDAVNRAIDEAIEKLYVATGLNTNGKRGGRLKKRGRERDADVLVAIGNPTFGNVRGRAAAAPKALVTTLAKRYRMSTLSERNTSKLCDECGSELVKTRGHSVRYWRLPVRWWRHDRRSRRQASAREGAELGHHRIALDSHHSAHVADNRHSAEGVVRR